MAMEKRVWEGCCWLLKGFRKKKEKGYEKGEIYDEDLGGEEEEKGKVVREKRRNEDRNRLKRGLEERGEFSKVRKEIGKVGKGGKKEGKEGRERVGVEIRGGVKRRRERSVRGICG